MERKKKQEKAGRLGGKEWLRGWTGLWRSGDSLGRSVTTMHFSCSNQIHKVCPPAGPRFTHLPEHRLQA